MNYTKQDIGTKLTHAKLVEVFNDNPGGAFIFMRGYRKAALDSKGKPKDGAGEVADYLLRAIRYDKLRERSIAMLNDWMMGLIPTLAEFTATYSYWKDLAGNRHSVKAKGRAQVSDKKTYKWNDEIVQAAMEKVMSSLTDPTAANLPDWDDLAKGLSSLDSTGKIYLRNVVAIEKHVKVEGKYRVECSETEQSAIEKEIRKHLPVGALRTFILSVQANPDGDDFTSLSIGGKVILADETGFMETLPAFVKYLEEPEPVAQ